MSAEEKKEGEATEAAPKKSKKKLLIVVVGVVLLLLGAGVPLLMMGGGAEEGHGDEHATEQEEIKHYTTVALDTFIVNLSANSAFLKVSMMLEIDQSILDKAALAHGAEGAAHGGGASGGGGEAAGGGMHPILMSRQPMIKDVIIRILSSKKPEEVLTATGKEKLKEELIEGINEAIGLDDDVVVNIYFTEFMVQ